ncbi:MAG: AAC(3) family N-acetyltransferase [Victivallaceae bacterium]|nr:AAC(3) family N-acetyltransferase [Victivallaceae bacterium]
MGELIVTEQIIVNALEKLGIKAGDVVFLHSSLKSFGYVEGGAPTVVNALLKVLGADGTLAVPTFSTYFWDSPSQVWDRQRTPSTTGVICEAVRLHPAAKRSPHAPHPIAAVGRLAEDLTERYNLTDFSDDSPFARLIELNAAIVMAGVSFSRCTLFHLLEEKFQVPYRQWQNFSGTVVDQGVTEFKTFPFYRTFIPGVRNNFEFCEEQMLDAGLIKTANAGLSKIMTARAQDIYDFIAPRIQDDPYYLVTPESRDIIRKFFAEPEPQGTGESKGPV